MTDLGTDANGAQAPASDSSALAKALDSHSDKQNEPQGSSVGQQQVSTPDQAPKTTSAGTLNAGTGQSQEDQNQVPWHKDKRWQQWQSEKKELEDRASRADLWERAMKEHPEFRSRLIKAIDELTSGSGGQAEVKQEPSQYDLVAEKLLASGPFKDFLKRFDSYENALQAGSKELQNQRFQAAIGNYRAQFKDLMKDVKIHPNYQKDFERNIWESLSEINPEAIQNNEYDPASFEQAVRKVQESYKDMINGVISDFTKQASSESIPRTQAGGMTPIGTPKTEEEEFNSFVSQLRSLQ